MIISLSSLQELFSYFWVDSLWQIPLCFVEQRGGLQNGDPRLTSVLNAKLSEPALRQ